MSRRPSPSDFQLGAGVRWLNGGYNSPLPRVARAAVDEAYELQASPDRLMKDAVSRYPDAIRTRLGDVLKLPADEIGVTNSGVFGATLAAHALTWTRGDRVLVAPDEYPANVYPYLALEPRGLVVERIGTTGEALRPEQLAEALGRPGRVRALCVAATHYLTGDLHPLDNFAAQVHERDARMIVDATQTAGAVALDWSATGADVILMSGYKWLLGPYGTGALWARPDFRDAMARVAANWWALAVAPDMDRVMRELPREFQAHGRCLDAGQSAMYLNVGAWRAGLELLLEIGVPQIEAHLRALQDRLVASLAGLPLRVVTTLDAPHRSPILILDGVGDVDLAAVVRDLAERAIHVSLRAGRVRVSPGIWSDESDVDAFVAGVGESLQVAR